RFPDVSRARGRVTVGSRVKGSIGKGPQPWDLSCDFGQEGLFVATIPITLDGPSRKSRRRRLAMPSRAECSVKCKSHDLIQRATSDQLRYTGRDRPQADRQIESW